MELQDLGWLCMVTLFLASLVIVLVWFVQYCLAVLPLWRAKWTAKRDKKGSAWQQFLPKWLQEQNQARGVWGILTHLRSGWDGRAASEAGVKGLVTSLFSFKSFREHWQRAWVKALNEQARRHGSSIQITFDSSLQLNTTCEIESVACTDQSAHRMVLQCKCRVGNVMFPVSVTQQSAASVSMETYQIHMVPVVAKMEICLEEVENEGLLMSWSLSRQSCLSISISSLKIQKQGRAGEGDLEVIRRLMEDTLFGAQPAMVLDLKTCVSGPLITKDDVSAGSQSFRRLHLRQIRVTLSKDLWLKSGEICCVLNLDQPSTEKTTRFLSLPKNPSTPVEWSEDISFDLGLESKELRIRLLERNGKREKFLPGHASFTLEQSKVSQEQRVFSISPGYGLAPNATVTAEVTYVETGEPSGSGLPLCSSLSPTKKVDVDRTIMPDGTIVTTVTTVQSRLKLDHSPGDSPLRSPSKVEVTEKKPTILSDGKSSSSPNPSMASRLSNGLDPVAETAIRQLTESKVVRKTPTKRSTLIISGVSKVPLSKDDCSLSSGYAAAMDAALHGNHYGAGLTAEPDETTPSDVSERPSVDDVESDTGSNGALETRSLKDHKVGFLQSGTKLLFRRKHREKESCFSQSHEDVSNMENNFAVSTASTHKKSGSFSRRLIKRFSFRTSSKSKSKASANGGASSLDN
ncbi:phospholipid transfer protein C2CD2L isoform X1 [Eucyclogobius newberryi]|uniref:phospholipid transfer protein C2CD2L isoform X1 n=1 Tax=Eucyclogobius newberryi TaxID=166745 RepID=UPI003B5A0C10